MPAIGYAFVAPWPPTINHYWRVPQHGPRAGIPKLSQAARDYRSQFARIVLLARIPRRAFPLAVDLEIDAYPPDHRRRDLDNLLKPVLDALVSSAIILDDSQVHRICIRRLTVRAGGELQLSVRPLIPAAAAAAESVAS